MTSGRVASRYRSANGSDNTHWRTGCCGRTSSTSSAAVSAIRRAPQLGQKPRRLQLNATSFSAWQASHLTRRKPCSSKPQRNEKALGSIEVGKLADLVVLDNDLFEVDPYEIWKGQPSAVMMAGEVVQGSLPE